MRIAVTGADGFIGRNLRWHLRESGHADIVSLTRATPPEEWAQRLRGTDVVYHLAGVNRPPEPSAYGPGNAGTTDLLCSALARAGSQASVVYASSTQAALENAYGRSKRAAEERLFAHERQTGARVYCFRLPNVFGKWSRPDYNSAVATFCHRIARNEPITVNDPAARLRLAYVDDVVTAFAMLPGQAGAASGFREVEPVYEISVGELADTVRTFAASRQTLMTERVGAGLLRALYSTYVSFLPPSSFAYDVPQHSDPRGVFIEMLKTPDCGQFSCFTAGPGVTRGSHYHHSKTEKFLVLAGTARFGFRQVETGETHEIVVRGREGRIVESIPGWAHDVTNVGNDDLIVMLWANEVFDRQRPDTTAMKVRA
jgi:UDP-2-acetamido-2,6-beta-L-arabino-hexul-4-ose reductase